MILFVYMAHRNKTPYTYTVMQVDDTHRDWDSVYVTVDEPDNNFQRFVWAFYSVRCSAAHTWTKKKRDLEPSSIRPFIFRVSCSCCAQVETILLCCVCRFECLWDWGVCVWLVVGHRKKETKRTFGRFPIWLFILYKYREAQEKCSYKTMMCFAFGTCTTTLVITALVEKLDLPTLLLKMINYCEHLFLPPTRFQPT